MTRQCVSCTDPSHLHLQLSLHAYLNMFNEKACHVCGFTGESWRWLKVSLAAVWERFRLHQLPPSAPTGLWPSAPPPSSSCVHIRMEIRSVPPWCPIFMWSLTVSGPSWFQIRRVIKKHPLIKIGHRFFFGYENEITWFRWTNFYIKLVLCGKRQHFVQSIKMKCGSPC